MGLSDRATARQHPGESMAEWCAEGLGRFLNDPNDPLARELRRVATVRLVPNMNPDGAVAGYLRVNAAGANLNREWASGVYEGYDAPTLERSPEVYWTLKAMDQLGIDAHVDIHGDEAIAANFFAGTEGIPSWDDALATQLEALSDAFLRRSPDFQVGLGYDVEPPGEGNMAVGSNAVAERYNALSVTLEMPFKDTTPAEAASVAAGLGPPRRRRGAWGRFTRRGAGRGAARGKKRALTSFVEVFEVVPKLISRPRPKPERELNSNRTFGGQSERSRFKSHPPRRAPRPSLCACSMHVSMRRRIPSVSIR